MCDRLRAILSYAVGIMRQRLAFILLVVSSQAVFRLKPVVFIVITPVPLYSISQQEGPERLSFLP